MGLCCSTDNVHYWQQLQDGQDYHLLSSSSSSSLASTATAFASIDTFINNPVNRNLKYGIGLGIAMMIEHATALTATSQQMDVIFLEGQVRKAKAEGRTVTVSNGCIYIDYQPISRISPGINCI